jgi:hypothetical protein
MFTEVSPAYLQQPGEEGLVFVPVIEQDEAQENLLCKIGLQRYVGMARDGTTCS